MKRKNHHREYIALSLIEGFGNRLIQKMLKKRLNPADLFRMDVDSICRIVDCKPSVARKVTSFNRWDEVDDVLGRTDRSGAKLLSVADPGYPDRLKHISDPPSLLWVKGEPGALSKPGIAVVGTRSSDRYGREEGEKWSRQAVEAGLSVISGLAYGIDTIAHETAVRSGGITSAVLGSGIDRIYPRRNIALAERILGNGGAIASEFPPGTTPKGSNFPRRNRVVSGLSLGVLVIQSGLKGGSMITARSALDEGREVFVIPHSLKQKRGFGNNYLVKTSQGKLVQEFDDILVEISYQAAEHQTTIFDGNGITDWRAQSLTKEQREVCKTLSDGEMQIEGIAEITGQQTFDLLPVLLELEMEGVIVQRSGKYFELK